MRLSLLLQLVNLFQMTMMTHLSNLQWRIAFGGRSSNIWSWWCSFISNMNMDRNYFCLVRYSVTRFSQVLYLFILCGVFAVFILSLSHQKFSKLILEVCRILVLPYIFIFDLWLWGLLMTCEDYQSFLGANVNLCRNFSQWCEALYFKTTQEKAIRVNIIYNVLALIVIWLRE